MPTELAALAAGVSEATIRKWASRGKLTRYGRRGRAEYDLDEIVLITAGTPSAGRRSPERSRRSLGEPSLPDPLTRS